MSERERERDQVAREIEVRKKDGVEKGIINCNIVGGDESKGSSAHMRDLFFSSFSY